jgi:hypothetical protein
MSKSLYVSLQRGLKPPATKCKKRPPGEALDGTKIERLDLPEG